MDMCGNFWRTPLSCITSVGQNVMSFLPSILICRHGSKFLNVTPRSDHSAEYGVFHFILPSLWGNSFPYNNIAAMADCRNDWAKWQNSPNLYFCKGPAMLMYNMWTTWLNQLFHSCRGSSGSTAGLHAWAGNAGGQKLQLLNRWAIIPQQREEFTPVRVNEQHNERVIGVHFLQSSSLRSHELSGLQASEALLWIHECRHA